MQFFAIVYSIWTLKAAARVKPFNSFTLTMSKTKKYQTVFRFLALPVVVAKT